MTFMSLFMAFSSNIYASSGKVKCIEDREPLNVWGSVRGYNLVTSLACDANVTILNENAGEKSSCPTKMLEIEANGKHGYVCGKYIEKLTATAGSDGYVQCIEDTSPLSMWDNINLNKKINRLSCNTKVTILDTNGGKTDKCSNWYKIKVDGVIGYACGKYIRSGSAPSSSTNDRVLTGSDNIYVQSNYNKDTVSDGTISCYEDTGDLSLKDTIGGAKTGSASCGERVKINSSQESSGSCRYYYNVTNEKGQTGYVCGYYVNTKKLSDKANEYYNNNGGVESYYSQLRRDGFPDSYLAYLAEIHARHPNWKFNPEPIKLDFNDVVKNESYSGRNLLDGGFNKNYYSMNLNTYDILSNTFYPNPYELGWYDASSEAIAFYLDPRNYLNEKYIFAFEDLRFNNLHTSSMMNRLLGGMSIWGSIYPGNANQVGEDVFNVGRDVGLSAMHIASRIRNEIGGVEIGDARLGGDFKYNGTPKSGYYNFYNIAVYGEDKINRGMRYAYDNGWDSPYKGILGGANFIYNNYTQYNQDTIYYEKFDVSSTNENYTNQYQQNLAVACTETSIAYNIYMNNMQEYFDQPLTFTIPVYSNMSSYAVTSPRLGNPNNYLKDLKVNGNTVSGFSYDKYDYEISLPAGTINAKITASPITNASVSGAGNISISSNKTNVAINVTSESGRVRTYNITLKRASSSVIAMSTMLNNMGFKYNDKYIYGISENTGVTSLINNIRNMSSLGSVNITGTNGVQKNNGVFKTGDKVTINNGQEKRDLNVVIYGDVNGDGVINKYDAANALSYYYGYISLTNANKKAADVNKDGTINKYDAANVLSHYYGYIHIEQ